MANMGQHAAVRALYTPDAAGSLPGMATKLPTSRNRNLPPPPAHRTEVHQHPLQTSLKDPAPVTPGGRRQILRNSIVMLLMIALLGGGIWYYLEGARADEKKRAHVENSIRIIAAGIWEGAITNSLTADAGDAQKDLDDLPRVLFAVKHAARGAVPRILILEDPTPLSRRDATHRVLFQFNERPVLILRLRYEPETDSFRFLTVNSPFVPSRMEMEQQQADALKAAGAAGLVPASPAAPPAPSATDKEKVSEPATNPQ